VGARHGPDGVDVVLVTLSVLGVAATIFLVNRSSGSR
jgi:hypothetical protein